MAMKKAFVPIRFLMGVQKPGFLLLVFFDLSHLHGAYF